MAFSHDHYFPILLTRRGERRALADTTAAVKARLTPVFEIAPVPWDYESEQPAKSVAQHVEAIPPQLVEAWGREPAYVDVLHLDGEAVMPDGTHPLAWLVAQAAELGLTLTPAVSLSSPEAVRMAARGVHEATGSGILLRISPADWPSNLGHTEFDARLEQLGVTSANCDLMLDLADSVTSSLSVTAVRNELTALPHANDWRGLVIAGGSFPATTPQGGRQHRLDRNEWDVYRQIVGGADRLPAFADYGIAHPSPYVSEVDPAVMSISATLRYTTQEGWLIAKGGLFKGRGGTGLGGAAMVPVARELVSAPEFAGPDYTWGDRWIYDTAQGDGTGGNPETWRRAGTSHHLRTVTDQLASLHVA